MSSSSLYLHTYEWVIILLFSLFISLLGFLSYSRSQKTVDPSVANTLLTVYIEGAVSKPGYYQLPVGSYVKDAIILALPQEDADLSFFKIDRQLQENEQIKIPQKKWITVYIEGAVNHPSALEIMAGTRQEDLLDMLDFLPEADLRCLRKKKHVLREGETVYISARKLAKRSSKKKKIQ